MKKVLLFMVLLYGTITLNAQLSVRYSYFRLLNLQESVTDIRVLSLFGSADNIPPPFMGTIQEIHSDTLFFKVLYKARVSFGWGSSAYRDDTFYNVAIPASINYLNISGNMLQIDSNGDVTDTSWNETDSTFVLHPVGINDLSKNVPHISVYPNPSNNRLFFEAGLEYSRAQVYNSIGQKVLTLSKSNSIDISALPNGLYFISLTGKKEDVIGRARFVKVE